MIKVFIATFLGVFASILALGLLAFGFITVLFSSKKKKKYDFEDMQDALLDFYAEQMDASSSATDYDLFTLSGLVEDSKKAKTPKEQEAFVKKITSLFEIESASYIDISPDSDHRIYLDSVITTEHTITGFKPRKNETV